MLMNPALSGLRCIRCATLFPGDYPEGCPSCLEAGHPASLECVYTPSTSSVMSLPVLHPITLGEGDTPCLESAALAQAEGVGRLWLKCESANPTGSHKDRMAAQLVSRARLAGATRVAAASSGNAGVSRRLLCRRRPAGRDRHHPHRPTLQREAMQRFGAHSPRSTTAWPAGRTWPSYAANKAPSPAPTT